MSDTPTRIDIPDLRAVEERLTRLERAHNGHQHGISRADLFTEPPDQKVGVTISEWVPDRGGYADEDFDRWHQEALARGFEHNRPRYFLRPYGAELWQETDEGGFIAAERTAGFYAPDGGVATGSFGTSAIEGRCVYPPRPPEADPAEYPLSLDTSLADLALTQARNEIELLRARLVEAVKLVERYGRCERQRRARRLPTAQCRYTDDLPWEQWCMYCRVLTDPEGGDKK